MSYYLTKVLAIRSLHSVWKTHFEWHSKRFQRLDSFSYEKVSMPTSSKTLQNHSQYSRISFMVNLGVTFAFKMLLMLEVAQVVDKCCNSILSFYIWLLSPMSKQDVSTLHSQQRLRRNGFPSPYRMNRTRFTVHSTFFLEDYLMVKMYITTHTFVGLRQKLSTGFKG